MQSVGIKPAFLAVAIGLTGLLGTHDRAAADDWEPIVVQVGKPAGRPAATTWVPPLPHSRAVQRRKAPLKPAALPANAPPRIAPVPAGTSSIVTGAIGSEPSTRHLSPADAQRLEEEPIEATGATGDDAAGQRIQQSDLAKSYCVSIGDAAADARIAWQRSMLAATEKKLDARIAVLEAKTAEYKEWLKRRDEFSRRATESLVQIYARMEPDSAALQLVAMDEETAAAVLNKLNPRNASAILNDMDPGKAARLTATIAGAARKKQQAQYSRQAVAGNQGGQGNEGGQGNQGNRPQPQPQEPNQGGQTP
jgi:flagellar motility protein MotE (MotC chaperone)